MPRLPRVRRRGDPENSTRLVVAERTEQLKLGAGGRGGELDVDARERGGREGDVGQEEDNDMAEWGERGEGECELRWGNGEGDGLDRAGGKDDAEEGERGSGGHGGSLGFYGGGW